MTCLDIHKSLAPYIRERYLKPEGITKETIYPDFNAILRGLQAQSYRENFSRQFARFNGLTYFRRRSQNSNNPSNNHYLWLNTV